jgi:hypothetical protein
MPTAELDAGGRCSYCSSWPAERAQEGGGDGDAVEPEEREMRWGRGVDLDDAVERLRWRDSAAERARRPRRRGGPPRPTPRKQRPRCRGARRCSSGVETPDPEEAAAAVPRSWTVQFRCGIGPGVAPWSLVVADARACCWPPGALEDGEGRRMPGGRRNLQKEMRCLEHKRVDDRMRMLGGTCGGETKRGK